MKCMLIIQIFGNFIVKNSEACIFHFFSKNDRIKENLAFYNNKQKGKSYANRQILRYAKVEKHHGQLAKSTGSATVAQPVLMESPL